MHAFLLHFKTLVHTTQPTINEFPLPRSDQSAELTFFTGVGDGCCGSGDKTSSGALGPPPPKPSQLPWQPLSLTTTAFRDFRTEDPGPNVAVATVVSSPPSSPSPSSVLSLSVVLQSLSDEVSKSVFWMCLDVIPLVLKNESMPMDVSYHGRGSKHKLEGSQPSVRGSHIRECRLRCKLDMFGYGNFSPSRPKKKSGRKKNKKHIACITYQCEGPDLMHPYPR